MEFEFHATTRIIFGKGAISRIGALSKESGKKALIVSGKSINRVDVIRDLLKTERIPFSQFAVEGEPTVRLIEEGINQAKSEEINFIIGCGGGSALDAGKAIASLLTNGGVITDYLEVVGKGKPITKPSMPYIAIPTTAGTGTEVTRNSVLAVPEQKVKVSLRSPYLLPKVAIVDAQLTYTMPPDVTARTGLDALTQLIEPYTSNRTNPIVDGTCREGIRRAARSLLRAYEYGHDESAREDMCVASLFGGLALANGKLAAVHGIAGPLGGMIPIPHGTACACLLPYVLEVNFQLLKEHQELTETLERYQEIARMLTGNANAEVEEGISWVKELCQKLNIPRLSDFGLTLEDFPLLIEKSLKASSMKGNAVKLTSNDMNSILTNAL